MTREEVKKMKPIIEAFSEGKEIQIFNDVAGWVGRENLIFDLSPKYYRIKPELKYRPFKDQEECWNEMQKHQPFGWVKHIYKGNFKYIIMVCKETIQFVETDSYLYEDAFKYYKFSDGTPFGIKED